jgi:hypothetical protein
MDPEDVGALEQFAGDGGGGARDVIARAAAVGADRLGLAHVRIAGDPGEHLGTRHR